MQKAIDDGHDRIVVILTRPKDTVREQKRDIGPARILKRSHPEAAEKLLNRYQTYNDEVALAKEYEQDGRVLILAPESLYGLNTLSKVVRRFGTHVPRGLCGSRGHPRIPRKLKITSISNACQRFVFKLRHDTKIL